MNIPFYPNLKDDTHCFQACFKMILKYYFPQKNFSYKFLDQVTAHKRGKWTWNSAGMLFLSRLGLEVISITPFDWRKFASDGEKYLKRIWNLEIFETQKKYSDFDQEKKLARKLIQNKKIKIQKRKATLTNIRNLFLKKYIILAFINPYVIQRKKGYASHSVLITNLDKKSVSFHDPGLPPMKNRKVTLALFLKAAGYPKNVIDLIAVRLPKHKS